MLDDLDRILLGEPVVSPSSDFASRVMRAVRRSCVQFAPLPFPWQRFVAGLVGGLVCTFVTATRLMSGSRLNHTAFDATAWKDTLSRGLDPGLLGMTVALVMSLLVVRLSVMYASR